MHISGIPGEMYSESSICGAGIVTEKTLRHKPKPIAAKFDPSHRKLYQLPTFDLVGLQGQDEAGGEGLSGSGRQAPVASHVVSELRRLGRAACSRSRSCSRSSQFSHTFLTHAPPYLEDWVSFVT